MPATTPSSSPATLPATDSVDRWVGVIAYADEGLGPRYLALPIGPGHDVEICGPGGCWVARSTDAGPSLQRQREGRIADVAVDRWEDICGASRAVGLCVGWWAVVP